jgi:hypothetical protein
MTALTRTPAFHLAGLLALAGLLDACSCGGTSGLSPGSVNGLVMNAATGVGLTGAAVSGGGKSTTTDSRGYFSLEGLTSGPVTVSVTLAGFAPAYATPRASDKPESTLVTMKAQGTPQTYSPSATKTLSQSTEAGPYAVSFTGGSLDTTDSNLTVSITPVDPTKEASVLPGSFVTTSSQILFPVTFAEFSILDSSGNRVQLKSGQSATVELPIPVRLRSQYPLDAKIHCYAFNPATGAWDDFVDGTVRASSVDGATPVLAAAIKHFSWYGGAPQGNDCQDVVGRVVSAVDGTPLGNARVEATPGGYTYTDADGYFTVVAESGSDTSFTAYQTGYDVDGSLTGMKGAKYIEFGEVQPALTGLTSKPCTTTAPAGAAPPAGTLGGRDNPVSIKVGLAKLAYNATAILSAGSGGSNGSVLVTLQSGVPGSDGKLTSPGAASGAKITLSSGSSSTTLAEVFQGTGLYELATGDTFAISAGHTYQLAIDADGNGSIDGTGTASVVGDLAFTAPTEGGTYPASGFTTSWTDTGTALGGSAYSAVYYLAISGTSTGFYQFSSALQATPYDVLRGPGNALPPGSYTASLVAFSGFFSGAGSNNIMQANNISGVGLTGTALSVGGAATDVNFTLQ